MMSDYEMPLFNRYPLSVEFSRHRWYIRQSLSKATFAQESEGEIVASHSDQRICPLVLHTDVMWIEQERERSFTAHIPYEGDDQLWHLYPGGAHSTGIDGEVFRSELLLSSRCRTAASAVDGVSERLQRIESIIKDQSTQIEAFENGLPDYVRTELHKRRAWTGGEFNHLFFGP